MSTSPSAEQQAREQDLVERVLRSFDDTPDPRNPNVEVVVR